MRDHAPRIVTHSIHTAALRNVVHQTYIGNCWISGPFDTSSTRLRRPNSLKPFYPNQGGRIGRYASFRRIDCVCVCSFSHPAVPSKGILQHYTHKISLLNPYPLTIRVLPESFRAFTRIISVTFVQYEHVLQVTHMQVKSSPLSARAPWLLSLVKRLTFLTIGPLPSGAFHLNQSTLTLILDINASRIEPC